MELLSEYRSGVIVFTKPQRQAIVQVPCWWVVREGAVLLRRRRVITAQSPLLSGPHVPCLITVWARKSSHKAAQSTTHNGSFEESNKYAINGEA